MVQQLLNYLWGNLVVNAGNGIFGHPDRPTHGAEAFHVANDASVKLPSLKEAAATLGTFETRT
jgi:2,3-diketo-5-methylthiopentyl-1-phosphate enolase